MGRKLPRKFYSGTDTVEIARQLLGKLLVIPDEEGRRVSGMIVETEAYLGAEDRGAHSYGGRRTARNEVMYGVAGHVYVVLSRWTASASCASGVATKLRNIVTSPPVPASSRSPWASIAR